MPDLTPEELDRLESLAWSANVNERWQFHDATNDECEYPYSVQSSRPGGGTINVASSIWTHDKAEWTMRFIAAADPHTIRTLVRMARRGMAKSPLCQSCREWATVTRLDCKPDGFDPGPCTCKGSDQ